MKKNLFFVLLAVSAIGGTIFASAEGAPEEVTTLSAVFQTGNFPNNYYDEDGNPTGYEVSVLKLIDERLPEYEIEFSDASSEAIYTGLSTGKYDIGLTNAFYTEERAENYILPENQIGASPMGLVLRKEDEDVTSFEEVASRHLRFEPQLTGNGQTRLVEVYNEGHPDNQIEFEYTDQSIRLADVINYLLEDRIDAGLSTYFGWVANVEDEEGALHEYLDTIAFNLVTSVPTYPVISKDNEDFAEKANVILKELKEDGTLEALAVEFFNINTFAY